LCIKKGGLSLLLWSIENWTQFQNKTQDSEESSFTGIPLGYAESESKADKFSVKIPELQEKPHLGSENIRMVVHRMSIMVRNLQLLTSFLFKLQEIDLVPEVYLGKSEVLTQF
jgi:hypothetical protein